MSVTNCTGKYLNVTEFTSLWIIRNVSNDAYTSSPVSFSDRELSFALRQGTFINSSGLFRVRGGPFNVEVRNEDPDVPSPYFSLSVIGLEYQPNYYWWYLIPTGEINCIEPPSTTEPGEVPIPLDSDVPVLTPCPVSSSGTSSSSPAGGPGEIAPWGVKFKYVSESPLLQRPSSTNSPIFPTYCSKTWSLSLLPAMQSNTRYGGGVDVPGALPGLAFKAIPSIARHKVPGFQPVYQHMGIDSVTVTMVGCFTGADGEGDNVRAAFDNMNVSLLGDNAADRRAALRKLDSYRSFQEFYRIAVQEGRELAIEVNLKHSNRFEGRDSTPPTGLRNSNGNPEFKGLVKRLETYYVRSDRTWYTMDIELTDYKLISNEPINLLPPTPTSPTPTSPTPTSPTPTSPTQAEVNHYNWNINVAEAVKTKLRGSEYSSFEEVDRIVKDIIRNEGGPPIKFKQSVNPGEWINVSSGSEGSVYIELQEFTDFSFTVYELNGETKSYPFDILQKPVLGLSSDSRRSIFFINEADILDPSTYGRDDYIKAYIILFAELVGCVGGIINFSAIIIAILAGTATLGPLGLAISLIIIAASTALSCRFVIDSINSIFFEESGGLKNVAELGDENSWWMVLLTVILAFPGTGFVQELIKNIPGLGPAAVRAAGQINSNSPAAAANTLNRARSSVTPQGVNAIRRLIASLFTRGGRSISRISPVIGGGRAGDKAISRFLDLFIEGRITAQDLGFLEDAVFDDRFLENAVFDNMGVVRGNAPYEVLEEVLKRFDNSSDAESFQDIVKEVFDEHSAGIVFPTPTPTPAPTTPAPPTPTPSPTVPSPPASGASPPVSTNYHTLLKQEFSRSLLREIDNNGLSRAVVNTPDGRSINVTLNQNTLGRDVTTDAVENFFDRINSFPPGTEIDFIFPDGTTNFDSIITLGSRIGLWHIELGSFIVP